MKTLTLFVIRAFELLEAEGRVARRVVFQVLALALVWIAMLVLTLAGFLALAVALFLGLREAMHPALALVIVSTAPLAAAGVCLVFGRKLLERGLR